MVLLMFVRILGRREMVLLGKLTPIFLEMLIKEDLLLGMRLLLEVVLLVGKLFCILHCIVDYRGRIYGYYKSLQGSYLVERFAW